MMKTILVAGVLAGTLGFGVAFGQAASKTVATTSPAPVPGQPQAPGQAPAPAAPKPQPVPAKVLFGAVKTPSSGPATPIGFYSKGCLAGGQALPIDGPAWQVMRLSRNRNWGHPTLIAFIERLATDAKAHDGWSGLLVGDMSQPRGGPMTSGHASHQVGLDVDLWYVPAPATPLTRDEREKLSADNVVGDDHVSVNARWTAAHARLIKRATSYPEVERIFVNPAIKKSLCEGAAAAGEDRHWLAKVRPYWGHDDHFHVRLRCPAGSEGCKPQPPPAAEDGCGAELTHWLKIMSTPPPPPSPTPPTPKPAPPEHFMTLDALPAACKAVLADETPTAQTQPAATAAGKPK